MRASVRAGPIHMKNSRPLPLGSSEYDTVKIGLTITIRPVPPSHRGPLPAPAPLAPRSRAPARAATGAARARRTASIQRNQATSSRTGGRTMGPYNHMKNSRPLPVWVKVAEPSAIVPVSARDTAIPRSEIRSGGAAGGGGGGAARGRGRSAGGPRSPIRARQVPRVTEPRRSYALSSERAHKGCEAVTCRAADQNWSIF